MLRIIALLATYNERRFIRASLEHNIAQGLEVYLIDNESTDDTVRIAEQYLGRGLVGIESFPHGGVTRWMDILKRKAQLAFTLEADWFIHIDADEFRFAARHQTLAQAIEDVDSAGYNAANFLEYTFIPTLESADHDHPEFQSTMRRYYPFLPSFPHRLNAWKRQPAPVDLHGLAGHIVQFPGLKMSPESLPMRHYQCLSVPHAIEKYARRRHASEDMERGWHGWRDRFDASRITLPSGAEMREYTTDQALDPSNPRTTHFAASWAYSASDR